MPRQCSSWAVSAAPGVAITMALVACAVTPLHSAPQAPQAAEAVPAAPMLVYEVDGPWTADPHRTRYQHQTLDARIDVRVGPHDVSVMEFAAIMAEQVEGEPDTSSGPILYGIHGRTAYAGFHTVTTTGREVRSGIVLIRGIAGTPYLVVLRGSWPIEHDSVLASELQDIAASIHLLGQPPPEPSLEDWFGVRDPNVIQLPAR